MLESLAAWVLRTYVGEYVENLNTDQLSIGYGTVELENLPLKKTALQGLELPLEVKSGFIGRLKLSIPFRHPKSEPWIIHIDKLYLIAGPVANHQYDEELEKKREHERKQKQLDALEMQWQFGRSTDNGNESWWTSLYSSLSTTIMENLQLVITGVHIRYEDSNTDQDDPFAVGITIERLSVESANEKWEPEFLVSESKTKYKLIEIQKFALYWDSDTSLVGDLPSKDLNDALQRVIGRGHGKASFSQHDYIVNPVSSQVKLQRNCSHVPLRSLDEPRFVVDILLEEIPVTLSRHQFQSLSKLMKEFQRHFHGQKYRKWRPLCPKHKNAKVWWQFAGKCVLYFIQERNKRHTWPYIAQRARDIVDYVHIYTKHLTETIEDNSQKEVQARIEDELTFEELKILRKIAVTNVKKEEALRKAAELKHSQSLPAESNDGWLSGWWGWYGGSNASAGTRAAESPSDGPNERPQTEEEEQFLEEMQENIIDDSIFKRDTVFAHLNFHLESGHFKLMSTLGQRHGELQPLIEVMYHNVRWKSQVCPRTSTWQSNVSLGSLYVNDKMNEGDVFPYLVAPQSKTPSNLSTEKEAVFRLQFKKMPKSSKVGYSLKVKTEPIQVVYNPATIDHISEFFQQGNSSRKDDIHAIEQQILDAAWARYEELKSQTKTELFHAMDELLLGQVKTQEKRWVIELSIAAPQIVLPESFQDDNAAMILVDLGNLSFMTKSGTAKTENLKEEKIEENTDADDDSFVTPPSTPPSLEDITDDATDKAHLVDLATVTETVTSESLADKIYDRYTLELADLQVVVAKISEYRKEQSHTALVEDFTVVDKFTISLQLERRLIFTADPKWPSVTVSGDLSKLNLYFSEIKIQAMWKCLAHLMGSSSVKSSTPASDHNEPAILNDSMSPSLLDLTESDYYTLKRSEVTLSDSPSETSLDSRQKLGQLSEESCLVLGQFCINELCVYLSGRGRLIAEFKVDGVKSNYTKRPYDMSLSLLVFNIYLMDHIQKYGPEFEMLLSLQQPSNKQTASPCSPAFSVSSGLDSGNKVFILDVGQDREDFDSVITFDYNQVNPDSPSCTSNNPMRIASIQFNTMDIIANQETVVELTNFINSLFPVDETQTALQSPLEDDESRDTQTQQNETSSVAMEITATFHQLRMLMIRGVVLDQLRVARKVADVSIIDLWTQMSLGDKQVIEGSLGGLHVRDVTPEDIAHRDVLSVGCVAPDGGCVTPDGTPRTTGMFQDVDSSDDDAKKAFTFTFVKPKQSLTVDSLTSDEENLSQHIRLSVHMASTHYTHTHRFMAELNLCVGDFSSYANDMAQSLRTAATSMAIGLVTKQTTLANNLDYLSSSFTPSSTVEARTSSLRGSVMSLDSCDGDTAVLSEPRSGDKRRVYLHVTVETPVITLPRTASSSECLVAQLGRIVVYNTHLTSYDHSLHDSISSEGGQQLEDFNDIDRVYVDITDMSLYSSGLRNIPMGTGTSVSRLEPGTSSVPAGEHILHDTAMRLVLDRCSHTSHHTHLREQSRKPTINVSGRVTKPLQLVLSNSAYQQLLSTMDILSGKTDSMTSSVHSGSSSAVTSPLISPVSSPYDFSQAATPTNTPTTIPADTPRTTYPEPPPYDFSQAATTANTSTAPPPADTPRPTDPEQPAVPTIISDDLPISSEPTPIRASFDIPEFNIELKGILKDGEQGIVNVLFHDFVLFFRNTEHATTLYDVSLGGLVVEDLLQAPDSLYRHMMVSSPTLSKSSTHLLARSNPLSVSCPDISGYSDKDAHSTSLPLAFHRPPRKSTHQASSPLRPMMSSRNIFTMETREDDEEDMNDSVIEFLGKRSTKGGEREETLVKIKAVLVDRNSVEYIEKYDKTDRFVEVDFNSLDTTVNLQTWVVFLEFFGIGKGPEEVTQQEGMDTTDEDATLLGDSQLQESQAQINSEFKVRVSALSLTLNKAKYPLTKAKITGLSTLMMIRENNLQVSGKLMKINLTDMSPHGALYKEKFTTCGKEALDFEYFRYGDPDPDLLYDYDMKIKLRMSAVQYIHTKRFQSELMAFATHFSQIQESLRRMRTLAAGNQVAEASTRGTRISLDISAGSPVIIFPRSSSSKDLLVADLGHLTLKNQFIFARDEGSICRLINAKEVDDEFDIINERSVDSDLGEPSCLLDHMEVELVDIDLFSAIASGIESDVFTFRKQGNQLLKETCKLDLMVERNLDLARSRAVPDMSIWGALSSMFITLDYSQYGLILGFLGENLGEPVEEFERPSSFVADAFGEPVENNGKVWTTFKMIIELVNVKVELLPSTSLHDTKVFIDPSMYMLAKIDFIKSKFVFESFSDWSKTMDLVSQNVLLYDTRYEGSSERCFTEVLRRGKVNNHDNTSLLNSFMFEVHYRDSLTRTTMTIIFNNSRMNLILDAILDIYNFIMCNWDKEDKDPRSPEVLPEGQAPLQSQKMDSDSSMVVMEQSDVKRQKSFEMKMVVSSSEFVALQNLDVEDTNAVVLRITAVLAWRPHYKSQKPLSCSVQSLEIFSCNLSCEEESALSIIDPMTGLFELNAAERLSKRKSHGLLDATLESLPSLEVTLNSLNMRISYNDYKLYLSIVESVSKQLSNAMHAETTSTLQDDDNDVDMDKKQYFNAGAIRRLRELGFAEKDCVRALTVCHRDVESAATWLLLNAKPLHQAEQHAGNDSKSKLSGFQIRANSICVCLIDDCGGNDVPLVELLLQNLYFWNELHGAGDSSAHATFTADYYNRSVSGWEPLVEPWKCQVHWQKQRRTTSSPENVLLKIDAADRLDLNITSSLITMIMNTHKNWSEDYYGPSSNNAENNDPSTTASSSTAVNAGHFRKRAPFVPFLIRNKTGCPLHFATVTASPSQVVMTTTGLVFSGRVQNSSLSDSSKKLSDWREVSPGEQVPFEFKQFNEKQRHKETHELKVHQLVVQIEGWEQVSPVSVDKVGAFFRQALPAESGKSIRQSAARVVFEITLENGAQKIVTVKSSLMLKNKTDLPWEIKLRPPSGETLLPTLAPQSDFAIPLPCVQCPLHIRPKGKSTKFSSSPLEWKDVQENFKNVGSFGECVSNTGRNADKYRYCVTVQRDGYPMEPVQRDTIWDVVQPAHTITIIPPVVLVNLLPVELSYFIVKHSLQGNIKPGRLAFVYKVNHSSSLEFRFTTENLFECETLTIPDMHRGVKSCITHLELKDTKNRVLRLNAKIEVRPGRSLRISIFSSFWLVNDTGIPLVFRQEGSSQEMAGQFDEHEMARSLTPLLFSFSDRDSSFKCQMRIGKGQHEATGKPVWCMPFSLEYPREFTRIHSRQPDRRPDMVYDVGIDVRFGQGRFRDTRIVTFAPRYQFQNRSSHTLAFQQRHFVREQGTRNPEGTLTSPPGAQVVWHWDRTDLDQLLCIRFNDIPDCRWSGGFKIDVDDSFHVCMRCSTGSLLFMRAETMLKGAVFHIVFTDANQLPPPYRIDNMCEVPILFYQTRTEDHQRCLLQPKQSVPYAWDEPTLRRELTLGIVNDGSFVHFTLDKLGEKDELFYYNASYIAFTHTFTIHTDNVHGGSFQIHPVGGDASTSQNENLFSSELVLDVPQGTAVVLSKKEPYKRTQLWRMTSTGILFNEGSSSPFDQRKPSSSRKGLVLDVNHFDPNSLVRGRKPLQLILSKLSPQRKAFQTWSFTEDGRMRNQIQDYCVQPKLGGPGLHQGVDAVLNYCGKSSSDTVPVEQCISVQKLRPGSGMLLVKVLADGPTRAVRITDVRQQHEQDGQFGKDWMVVERRDALRETTLAGYTNDQYNKRTELQVRLTGGIGVSLINTIPEELVFATFSPIEMDYVRTNSLQSFDLNIGNIQIDDQHYLTQYPVMLFVTPSSKEDCTLTQPALAFSAANEPTKLKNCEIFKHLELSVRKLTLQVDERLLFKLLQFFGWVYNDDDVTISQDSDDLGIETQRLNKAVSASSLKRYYFEKFLFNAVQFRVSIATVTRLPEDLKQIKTVMGLILVRLQDAIVDFESFSRSHGFDTRTVLLDALSKHYNEELRGQAPFLLASVDFLGNPMGLFNDVSSGIEGLVRRGNVGGLFLNVAHGLSDTTAKLTGSLSDGLWTASSDSKSLESREAMRAERHHQSSGDHLVTGFKGLGMGLMGGLTSIVTQPIEGASEKGVPGFIQGIGKGILGTFAKPAAGVLDLASGVSAAVRGSATRSSRLYQPKRVRNIRNCFGPGGALPRFSKTNSEGQFIILKLNSNNMDEKFITSESVRTDVDSRVKVLLTNERIYFVKTSGVPSPESILVSLKFEDVLDCHHLKNEAVDYVELTRRHPEPPIRVRCETASAQKLVQKINYAKSLFEEVKQTVTEKPNETVT